MAKRLWLKNYPRFIKLTNRISLYQSKLIIYKGHIELLEDDGNDDEE